MAIFNTDYYRKMDAEYINPRDPEFSELEEPITAKEENIGLTPSQLGVSTPMGHPIQGVEANLKNGASKMEITFFGQGKGNRDRFTPESISKDERKEVQQLLRINKAKLSTHATVGIEGVAGFGKEGFNEEQREASVREIEKAIDFASEASTGGAIVFHTGEWVRPISEQRFGVTYNKNGFESFNTEKGTAPILTVDSESGRISGIRKDQTVYEPIFHTLTTFAQENNYRQDEKGNLYNEKGKLAYRKTGKTDSEGIPLYIDEISEKKPEIYADEWVDSKGKFINPDFTDPKNTDRFFDRVPIWDDKHTRFEVADKKFDDYAKEAKKLRERRGINLAPEQLYVKTHMVNEALTAKGSSLYHARQYQDEKFQLKKLKQALEYFTILKDDLPKDEQWRLEQTREFGRLIGPEFDILPSKESKIDFLNRKIKFTEQTMRHIHEASASADAKAMEAASRINRIETIENYGMDKTSDSIAYLAAKVYQKNKHKAYKDQEDLYLAPENWDPRKFGAHPEEMTKIVQKAREKFSKKYRNLFDTEEKAIKGAEKIIKTTIDIGHLNQWRKHFHREPKESDKSFNKRFDNWVIKEIGKMHKAGTLGHFHLTDNFGYDDEHLTPGQGNAPIKEFVKLLKDKGYEDFIIEIGSFNQQNLLHDTWSYFGTPVYASHPRGSFRDFRQQHFQYKSTPLYIAGAYAPSNQFKTWSEVPLH